MLHDNALANCRFELSPVLQQRVLKRRLLADIFK